MNNFYRNHGKRLFDVVLCLLGLLLLAPVLVVVALLVRWRLGTPVFFRQVRGGKDGNPFTLLKFRTMADQPDQEGRLLPDAQRLTPFGRLLRSSSLDELPELLNVLNGDMSLVGPRPLRTAYLPLYNSTQARRHEVRPGITGWAQINGRNAIGWEERFKLDVFYVDNVNFLFDCRILALTLHHVVRQTGVSAAGHATMYPFTGAGSRQDRESPQACRSAASPQLSANHLGAKQRLNQII